MSQAGGVGAFRPGAAMWQGLEQGIQAHPQAIPLGSKPLEAELAEGEALGEKRVPGPDQGLSPWLWGLESVAVSIPSVFPEDTPSSSTRPSQAPQQTRGRVTAGIHAQESTGLGPGNIRRPAPLSTVLEQGLGDVGSRDERGGSTSLTGSSSLPGLLLPSSGELFHRWASLVTSDCGHRGVDLGTKKQTDINTTAT